MSIIKTATDNRGSFIQRATGLDALSGLGSLGGLASSVLGAISSIGQTRRQKDLMDYQSNLNQKMFNLQQDAQQRMYERQLADQRQLIAEERAYNDYASVKARAQKAGINPLFALGGTGGIGIQSSSGSAPGLGAASANGVSIASPDSIGSNLIAAGSTLASISRQNALLESEVRKANAEASISESEAKWRDKQLAQDYENSVTYNDFLDASILDKKSSARLATALAECQDIQKDILSVDRNVATATEQMRIDQFRTSLDLALDELKRSNIDTQFKRERVQAELDNLNAMTDSITQHIAIDWKNSNIAEMNAHTALKQYGLSREEFVSLDKYRDDMVRLEEQDQKLREKIERKRNTKDYIIHATDWINERAKISAEKERITNEYVKSASSNALQLLGIASRFVK